MSDKRGPGELKASREDMRNGPLGEIWNNFFSPILTRNTLELEAEEFFLLVFDGRTIETARTTRKLKCPGGYLEAPYVPNFGYYNTDIDKNTRVWIRSDVTQAFTDIETEDGRVFRMSNKQFSQISHHFQREH